MRDIKSNRTFTRKPVKPGRNVDASPPTGAEEPISDKPKMDKSQRVRESGDRTLAAHREAFEKLARSPAASTDDPKEGQRGRRETLEDQVTRIMDEYDEVLRKLADS